MSQIRIIEYNPDNEIVICCTAQNLSRCKLFERIFTRLYPKEHIGHITGYTTSTIHDTEYLFSQDIFVMNDKHINVVNSVGLDAFPRIKFVAIPKDMLFYIKVHDGYVSTNVDRYLIKLLMDKYDIQISDIISMKKEANRKLLYINNVNSGIRHFKNIYESSEEEMTF